jgi:hypothetical protein
MKVLAPVLGADVGAGERQYGLHHHECLILGVGVFGLGVGPRKRDTVADPSWNDVKVHVWDGLCSSCPGGLDNVDAVWRNRRLHCLRCAP